MKLGSVVVLVCLALAGCAGAPPAPPGEGVFADARFAAPSEPVRAADVFAFSDAMRRQLDGPMESQLRRKGLQRGLVDALYSRRELRLEYDAAMTRNAAQAFDARAGNCLSLVIMTAAFAKQLGLPVRYRTVETESSWSRVAGIHFFSGHVNLTLDAHPHERGGAELTVDFLLPPETAGQRVREIGEPTIVAMYMNNRAAEALAAGRVDDAYWWAREAIVQEPRFLGAYNTLGVVYLHHGDIALAERLFAVVLEREPRNTTALANLANALGRAGRTGEASVVAARLAQIEAVAPFHYFDLGLAAARAHDWARARELFAKQVARKPDYDEFRFWLALAHAQLGELRQAREQLTLAIEASTRRKDRDLYAAKLDRLRTQLTQ